MGRGEGTGDKTMGFFRWLKEKYRRWLNEGVYPADPMEARRIKACILYGGEVHLKPTAERNVFEVIEGPEPSPEGEHDKSEQRPPS